MTNMKKVPLRKCAATGEMFPKKEMIRIVRPKEGEVSVDLTGKNQAVGLMCQNPKKQSKLHVVIVRSKANLKTAVPEEVYEDLLHAIRREALK